MFRKPLPPVTPRQFAEFWAGAWGVKVGESYRVTVDDPTTKRKKEFVGVFAGITPTGKLVYTRGEREIITDMGLNVTLRHV